MCHEIKLDLVGHSELDSVGSGDVFKIIGTEVILKFHSD